MPSTRHATSVTDATDARNRNTLTGRNTCAII